MTDWNDLEQAWRSLPAKAAPAAEELQRQARWRWWSRFYVWSEVAVGIAGAMVGGWMIARNDVVIGAATLFLVAVASGSSWWARSLAPAKADDSVVLALELAVRRARIGVRLAFATLWSLAASLVFLGAYALALNLQAQVNRAAWVVFGVALIWLAIWAGGTLFYLWRRMGDLARLQALKASLMQED